MKTIYVFLIFMGLMGVAYPIDTMAQADNNDSANFYQNFLPKTLRVDYLLAGDQSSEVAYFVQMKEEPYWGGPRKNLSDPFGYGTYRYAVYDSATGRLLPRPIPDLIAKTLFVAMSPPVNPLERRTVFSDFG